MAPRPHREREQATAATTSGADSLQNKFNVAYSLIHVFRAAGAPATYLMDVHQFVACISPSSVADSLRNGCGRLLMRPISSCSLLPAFFQPSECDSPHSCQSLRSYHCLSDRRCFRVDGNPSLATTWRLTLPRFGHSASACNLLDLNRLCNRTPACSLLDLIP